MLTPDEIAALNQYAQSLTQPVTDFLLDDIARRVAKAGGITATAEYQIYRAQLLGVDFKTIEAEVAKRAGVAAGQLDGMFQFVEDRSIDFKDNKELQQICEAYLKTTKRDLETLLKTKNIGFVAPNGRTYPLQDAYLNSMDFAVRQVMTGSTDVNTAIRNATKELAAKGIRSIPRKDGRSMGIEYATRNFVMNNLSAVAGEINKSNHDAMGANGWELSAHEGSAPDHEPYQGQQFSDAAYAALNNRLARPIGTFRCKHMAYPIVLGLSKPAHTKAQLRKFQQENAAGVTYQGRHYTLYEAEQTQRGIESDIRSLKNRILIADATDDGQRLQTAQIRLGVLRREYLEFSRAAGLRTSSARMQVAEFGHSAAGKASASYRKVSIAGGYNDRIFNMKPVTNESIDAVPLTSGTAFTKAQAENLQAAHKALLRALQDMPIGTEAGAFLDENMLPLGDIVIGQVGRINMPSSTANAKALIHNHPSGETISLKDVSNFTTDVNLDILTAVGNDGGVFLLEKTNDFDFSKAYKMLKEAPITLPTSTDDLPKYISEMEAYLNGLEKAGIAFRNVRAK